jgi:hypothetical protein
MPGLLVRIDKIVNFDTEIFDGATNRFVVRTLVLPNRFVVRTLVLPD